MKKVIYWACAFAMVACGDETESYLEQESCATEHNGINVVSIINGAIVPTTTRSMVNDETLALAFDSEASYLKFKQKLDTVSDYRKMNIVNNFGVLNLHNLAQQADDELELISNSASSEEDFRHCYNEYKGRYKMLISNDTDTTDLTLYAPYTDDSESFIANKEGVFVVAGKVKSIITAGPIQEKNYNQTEFKVSKNHKIKFSF